MIDLRLPVIADEKSFICHSFAEKNSEFLLFYWFSEYTRWVKFDQTLALLYLHFYSANYI